MDWNSAPMIPVQRDRPRASLNICVRAASSANGLSPYVPVEARYEAQSLTPRSTVALLLIKPRKVFFIHEGSTRSSIPFGSPNGNII